MLGIANSGAISPNNKMISRCEIIDNGESNVWFESVGQYEGLELKQLPFPFSGPQEARDKMAGRNFL